MTIDHKKVALDLLSTATDMSFAFPDLKDHLVATAQVHATLAVAEQARIRNLFLSLGYVFGERPENETGLESVRRERAEMTGRLAAIREGLRT